MTPILPLSNTASHPTPHPWLENPKVYLFVLGVLSLVALFLKYHERIIHGVFRIFEIPDDDSTLFQLDDFVKASIKTERLFRMKVTITDSQSGREIYHKMLLTSLSGLFFLPNLPKYERLRMSFAMCDSEKPCQVVDKTIDFMLKGQLKLYVFSSEGTHWTPYPLQLKIPSTLISLESLKFTPINPDYSWANHRGNRTLIFNSEGRCQTEYKEGEGTGHGWIYLRNFSPFYQVITFTVQDQAQIFPPRKLTITQPPREGQWAYHQDLLHEEWKMVTQDSSSPLIILSVEHQAYCMIEVRPTA